MKKRINRVSKKLYKILKRPEMIILPGQIAFFLILSIVPTVTLLSYVASFFHLSMDFIYNFIAKIFNSEIANLFMAKTFDNKLSASIIMPLLIGYYIASKGASSIIVTSNTLYRIEQKPFLYRKIKSMFMIFILIALLLFILLVPGFGTKIIELINYVNGNEIINGQIRILLSIMKWPMSWFIIYFLIKTIFTIAPDEPIPSYKMTKGALFTTGAWIVITIIFSYYATHIARYSLYYGSLANIIVLMVWVYFLSFALTIGIAINSEEINATKSDE